MQSLNTTTSTPNNAHIRSEESSNLVPNVSAMLVHISIAQHVACSSIGKASGHLNLADHNPNKHRYTVLNIAWIALIKN